MFNTILLIFLGILVILLGFGFWDLAEKKKEASSRTDILNGFSGGDSEVFCGYSNMNGIAVGQKIMLMMGLQTLELEPAKIDSAEIVTNSSSSIQRTNRGSQVGRAVVGGVLLGPLGAAAGAVTGTKYQVDMIDAVVVRVVAQGRYYDVPFYEGVGKPASQLSADISVAKDAVRAIQRRRLGGGWETHERSIEERPASPGSSSPMY